MVSGERTEKAVLRIVSFEMKCNCHVSMFYLLAILLFLFNTKIMQGAVQDGRLQDWGRGMGGVPPKSDCGDIARGGG